MFKTEKYIRTMENTKGLGTLVIESTRGDELHSYFLTIVAQAETQASLS